jgi:cyclophilin family peptidyl-prolyl cis-trans isomerase
MIAPVLGQIQKEFPQDVRVVFRHFPLIGTPERPLHDKAALSAQAAEAAGLQGKFWEMHDLLYAMQGEWLYMSQEEFRQWLDVNAAALALDVERFRQDLDSEALVALAQSAWDWGLEVGLPGTPFILINGKAWDFNVPLNHFNLSAVVKLTLLEARQFSTCPPMTIDPQKEYIVTLKTEKGDIVLELFPDKAPLAVNSFVFLVRSGWYDQVTFHRVIPNYIAQAGDPTGTGFGGPGYAFENEIVGGLEFDREGLLAMANAGAGSNGSQFFITYGPAETLNGKYTIFGQVIKGMEVLRSLDARNIDENADLPPGDLILTATVEEK